jgi:hypothetical protein
MTEKDEFSGANYDEYEIEKNTGTGRYASCVYIVGSD